MNKRGLLVKIAAVLVLAAICVVLVIIGRGHSVYLDNKPLTYEGKTYEVPYKVTVYTKGEQTAKLYEGERGAATWMGQNFEMTLEIMQTKGGAEETRTVSVKLPHNADGIIVNLAGVLNDLPPEVYMEEFVPAVVEPEGDDTVDIGDELSMGDF